MQGEKSSFEGIWTHDDDPPAHLDSLRKGQRRCLLVKPPFGRSHTNCQAPLWLTVSTWTSCGQRLAPRRATAEPPVLARLVCTAYHRHEGSYGQPPPQLPRLAHSGCPQSWGHSTTLGSSAHLRWVIRLPGPEQSIGDNQHLAHHGHHGITLFQTASD